MTAIVVSLVALVFGLGVVRWHKSLARFDFVATPWSVTSRAHAISERGYLVLGVVLAGGAMVYLICSIVVAAVGSN